MIKRSCKRAIYVSGSLGLHNLAKCLRSVVLYDMSITLYFTISIKMFNFFISNNTEIVEDIKLEKMVIELACFIKDIEGLRHNLLQFKISK